MQLCPGNLINRGYGRRDAPFMKRVDGSARGHGIHGCHFAVMWLVVTDVSHIVQNVWHATNQHATNIIDCTCMHDSYTFGLRVQGTCINLKKQSDQNQFVDMVCITRLPLGWHTWSIACITMNNPDTLPSTPGMVAWSHADWNWDGVVLTGSQQPCSLWIKANQEMGQGIWSGSTLEHLARDLRDQLVPL